MPTAKNRTGRIGALLGAWMLLSSTMALSARAAGGRDVLAHGAARQGESSSPIWVALIQSKDGQEQTSLLTREKLGEATWVQMPKMPSRVVELTAQSTEAVVALKTPKNQPQRWGWWSNRFSYGPPLPERMTLLALAGDAKTLWALGQLGERAAATAATQSATRPVAPVLYQLTNGSWAPQSAAWPAGLDLAGPDDVSMVLIGGRPVVAVSSGDENIHLLQWDAGSWTRLGQIKPDSTPPKYFKILNMGERPVVWAQPDRPDDSLGGLWTREGKFIKLMLSGAAPRAADMDLTVAGDQVRLFFRRDGKLYEQRYAFDGSPTQQPLELNIEPVRSEDPMNNWVTIAVMAVLTILILNVLMRRRTANREEDEQNRSDEDE